jgi:hypothetical protein
MASLPVSIVYPDSASKLNSDSLLALFAERLHAFQGDAQQAELTGAMVASNNKDLGQFLTMLLRAKRFEELVNSLNQALFYFDNADEKGYLSFFVGEQPSVFQISGAKGQKLKFERVDPKTWLAQHQAAS